MTIDINELREAIQTFGSQAINEGDLNELLLRLESAEKDRDVLRDRLALESQENGALRDSIERACEERDTLQAKVEAMEDQEPVRHEFQKRDGTWHPFIDQRHYKNTVADGSWPIRALYALPGAKGE